MRAHLGLHGRLPDHEHGGAGVERAQVAGEHEGGVDDVVGRGGNPQPRQLGRVLLARLEGLVRQEGDAPRLRAQRGDRLRRAVDELLAQIDGSIQVNEPAAIRKSNRH